jgi:hypothetical protein
MAASVPDPGAEIDYYHGIALANLGRWEEARVAFLAGNRLAPGDERFPIELGGVAFKQKRYTEAAGWLRRGLRLKPANPYATDFLATIYFLQGNLEAALKYWNQIGKPQVGPLQIEPGLRTDPVLLDSAFALAPNGMMSLQDLLTTRARVKGLEVFPTFTFHLNAREDGKFDAAFAARERNGFGNSKLETLLSMFRGAVYQTIYPEYFNIGGSAINITSMLRWDTQKRRALVSLSAPLRSNSKYRYSAGVDLRNENWDVPELLSSPAPVLGEFNLRKSAVNVDITAFPEAGWSWSVGGEFSRRDYRSILISHGDPQNVLLNGYELKQTARLDAGLWRAPERRFESTLHISSDTATIWSSPKHTFERLQTSLVTRWLPRMTGDDYAIQHQVRIGGIFGRPPLDELYMLGLERDNDLWLRSHIGSRDGRKGNALPGRRYFLSNWEIDKTLYDSGVLNVKLSPFVDIAKVGSFVNHGSSKWLWDVGVQAKFRALGVGFTMVCGKDVRTGNNVFYLMASR